MTSRTRVTALAIVVGLLLAAVSWAVLRPSHNNPKLAQGSEWVCPKCGHSVTLTDSEVADNFAHHYGEGIKCPSCGAGKLVAALTCPKCGKVYPAHNAKKCPTCGTPAPLAQ